MKNDTNGMYFSPRELAARWRCSRSSVDRVAREAGFTRVCLGHGRNGMVRYRTEEVLQFERDREIKVSPC